MPLKRWNLFATTSMIAMLAPGISSADPAVKVASADATARAPEFTTHLRTIYVGTEVGAGTYGAKLLGSVGGESQGLLTWGGRRYLLQWGGNAEGVGGVVANTHPYAPVIGLRTQAEGQLGYRFMPASHLSPYVAVGLGGDGHAITQPGANLARPTTVNNLDGLGGIAGNANARLYFGGSLLEVTRSLLFAGFIQEEARSAQTYASGKAFTGGGLRAQFDISGSLRASLDGSIGFTGQQRDAALGTSTVTSRWAFTGSAVKTLGEHWLLGGSVSLAREDNTTSTAGSAMVYRSVEPLEATIGLQLGYKP